MGFTEGTAAVALFSGAAVGTGDTTGTAQSIKQLVLTVAGVADGASEKLTVNGVEIGLAAVATTAMANGTGTVNGLSYAVALTGSTATVTLTHVGLTTAQVAALVDAESALASCAKAACESSNERPAAIADAKLDLTNMCPPKGGRRVRAWSLCFVVALLRRIGASVGGQSRPAS